MAELEVDVRAHHALEAEALDLRLARQRLVGCVEGLFQRRHRQGAARLGPEADEMIEPVLGVAVEGAAVVEQDRGQVVGARGAICEAGHAKDVPGTIRTGN